MNQPQPAWNERLERLLAPLDRLFNRLYTSRYNPLYQTGTLAVVLLLVMLVTGLYLLIFYKIATPHQSVAAIQEQVWLGRWIRALHLYSADLAMAAVALHMLRMFLQGRAWGPRALAWISGLILLGVLLLSGWTGLVLVWDQQGQVIAMEGARLLDLLPLFSEPMLRMFTRSQGVSSTFFFLNLFAHIALPLGLALFLWVHTMRVARPALLPPRRLWWGMVAALFAFSLAVPAPLGPRADLLALADVVRLDWFFAFWVPLSRDAPAWAHLAAWGAGAALLAAVPWWWRPRPETRGEPSFLDEQLCTGCTQCSIDCPYEAITMVPRTVGTGSERVASVNPERCVSCGICAGSCAPMEIGPPLRNGKAQLREIRRFHERQRPGAADVVVLSCRNGVGNHPALSGLSGVKVHPIHCGGSLHTSVIEYLLRRGAGGVYVLACPDRDCVYREGPRWLCQRVYDERESELKARVDLRRVRVGGFCYASALAATEDVRAFQATLEALGQGWEDEGHVDITRECEPPPMKEASHG